MSNPWKILTTQELLHLPLKPPPPQVLLKLAERPLTRIAYCWRYYILKHGLSPFALAGISKHTPREVMTQIEKEGTRGSLSFCGDTNLPIFSLHGYWDDLKDGSLANYYDSDFPEEGEEGEDENGDPLPFTLEKLMSLYGGRSWKRHCTRHFDPFDKGCDIDLETWMLLREAYEGRGLKRVEVKE